MLALVAAAAAAAAAAAVSVEVPATPGGAQAPPAASPPEAAIVWWLGGLDDRAHAPAWLWDALLGPALAGCAVKTHLAPPVLDSMGFAITSRARHVMVAGSTESRLAFGNLTDHVVRQLRSVGLRSLGVMFLVDDLDWMRFPPFSVSVDYALHHHWTDGFAVTFERFQWLPLGPRDGFGAPPANIVPPAFSRDRVFAHIGQAWPPDTLGDTAFTTRFARIRYTALPRGLERAAAAVANNTNPPAMGGLRWVIHTPETADKEWSPARTRLAMLSAMFTFCPPGPMRETRCVYEAIEAGSIPIVDISLRGYAPWGDFPFPIIRNWEHEPPRIIESALKSGGHVIDGLQERTMGWWAGLVASTRSRVGDLLGCRALAE